jgi:sugar/nucleoside kinase (ribokinase family)
LQRVRLLEPPRFQKFQETLVVSTRFDVCGVGNAIVDLLSPASDQFLKDNNINKGTMSLIFDEADAQRLLSVMGEATTVAGGSGANTLAGIGALGGRGAYIGKVADDRIGRIFRESFPQTGVHFDTPAHVGGPPSAYCLINVTPDGERSMSTYLGCSPLITADDLDPALIAEAQIVFLEGYLFDADEAKAAFVRAAEIARAAGRKVALTLSDLFCVNRHGPSFRHLVANHIDILFANEVEIMALYDAATFDDALAAARADCDFVALTRSEKGSVLARGDEVVHVAAEPVDKVVDATGAGDLYAAGVLFGIATGRELEACGTLGSLAAAECISHMGPRPLVSLAALAAARGL